MAEVTPEFFIQFAETQADFLCRGLGCNGLGFRHQTSWTDQIMREQFVMGVTVFEEFEQTIEDVFSGGRSSDAANHELGDGQAHLDLTRIEWQLL
ncbi:hypothetical protein BK662_07160 [Pseudomonas frederiksbergensis]|uniref:Uncharacterized protein n=1 Tax=Pseudomonas frederiksbergensis TaxID=104087 RepID=A0A423HWG1_9PSED|nr:hypothetical protein BK662_07160 [Pseudomonas frederiksbergensis]